MPEDDDSSSAPPPSPAPGSRPTASHYGPELPLPEELQAMVPKGTYIVESFLGQGGMGAVYKGLQLPLRRPVAIKILAKRDTASAGEGEFAFEERFKREAYAMATLTHPNIVQVYDCGDAGENYLYISMELVEGGDLSSAMKGGQFAPEVALKLIPQICDGLQAAHERGLVHRDIKPANIFLTKDGRPKVADFGLAKKFDVQSTFATKTGMAMGTPDYAAPEQFDGVKDIDHRADIYSLGVMMYQMLTGILPRGAYKPPSHRAAVDPRLDDVVFRAMEHHRNERYQSVAEIKKAVQAITVSGTKPLTTAVALAPSVSRMSPAGTRPVAQPVTIPAPVAKGGRGRIAAVFGGVVLAGVLAAFMMMKPKDEKMADASAKQSPPAGEPQFINSIGMKFVPVPGTDVHFCIHETRRKDFAAYASEVPGVDPAWKNQQRMGIPCGDKDDEPVCGVRWGEAVAFCEWLSKKEGRTYRLPTDEEWSVAVGIGSKEKRPKGTTPEMLSGKVPNEFPWGGAYPPKTTERAGNYADVKWHEKFPNNTWNEDYDDGFATTAPVMSYKPNPYGLYDMGGNVREWVDDWWNDSKTERVMRGGSFYDNASVALLSSFRDHRPLAYREHIAGFRCVMTVPAAPSQPAPTRPPP